MITHNWAHADPRFEGILRGLKLGKSVVIQLEDMVRGSQKTILSRLCDRDADLVEVIFKEYVFTHHSFALPVSRFYGMLLTKLERERALAELTYNKQQSRSVARKPTRKSLDSSCILHVSFELEKQLQTPSVHARRRSEAMTAKPQDKLGYVELSDKKRQLTQTVRRRDCNTAKQINTRQKPKSLGYLGGSSLISTRPITPEKAKADSVTRSGFKQAYYN
jgi:hypothetical protein